MNLDDHNFYQNFTRTIRYADGRRQSITMEGWYWAVIDWMIDYRGYKLGDILAMCEEYRGEYNMDYALRYYAQEYVAACERHGMLATLQ